MATQSNTFEPGDWNNADILRALQVYSPNRLSCFGKNYLNATPSHPWDEVFMAEMKDALDTKTVSEELKSKILDALKRHYSNAEICSAFYPVVHSAEVVFRNALSFAIGDYLGDQDWLLEPDALRPSELFSEKDISKINDKKTISEGKADPQHTVTHSDVLAELELGFWVFLANNAARARQREAKLGQALVHNLIPHAANANKTRKYLSRLLTNALEVRNAIAHQYPIWLSADRLNLRKECQDVLNKTKSQELLVKAYLRRRHQLLLELINGICQKSGKIAGGDEGFKYVLSTSFRE